jgi:hypothetical protein
LEGWHLKQHIAAVEAELVEVKAALARATSPFSPYGFCFNCGHEEDFALWSVFDDVVVGLCRTCHTAGIEARHAMEGEPAPADPVAAGVRELCRALLKSERMLTDGATARQAAQRLLTGTLNQFTQVVAALQGEPVPEVPKVAKQPDMEKAAALGRVLEAAITGGKANSLRDAARQIGVGAATLSRIIRGIQTPTEATEAAIQRWVGQPTTAAG